MVRSIILNIRKAAERPSVIFFKAGVSCIKLKPGFSTQKKIVNTSPALYFDPLKHVEELSTQKDPNQNPKPYERKIDTTRVPIPKPISIVYFLEFPLTLLRVEIYCLA